ncbi:MAG: hypothetical protein RQ968_07955 [Thermoproteota archaeon]|jgi:hypothetical protein|nr:hypothetical protein [Thermoproteota archaeon]
MIDEEVKKFLEENNLNYFFNQIISEINSYLNKFNFSYSINYEIFEDLFDKSWKNLKIIINLNNVSDYSLFYTWNELCKIKNKIINSSKMIIIVRSNE